jgi:hypothetical protein
VPPAVPAAYLRAYLRRRASIETRVDRLRWQILPGEEMGVEEGDELFAVREADGSLRLTPYDPDLAEAVEDTHEFMDSHRNAFRELAQ